MSEKRQPWVPWVLLGAAIVVVVGILGACGGDGNPYPPIDWDATPDQQDDGQTYYNGYLRVARQQLRDTGADIYCQPDYWDLILASVDVEASQETLMELAMGDACQEAGALSDAASYSPYHANAP